MRTVLSGEVNVRYGQVYVESSVWGYAMDECFAGQSNGLCGSGAPGGLFLNTGLFTGKVGFTVELHDQEPPMDDAWEDVVEAPFRPLGPDVVLVEWDGEHCWNLGLEERDYRVRYCAIGMDTACAFDTRPDDGPQVDQYCLQFWPTAPSPDHVIKQTSEIAAHWHDFARELPPPLAEEEGSLTRETECHGYQGASARSWRIDAAEWGCRPPSPRLRQVGGNVLGMVTVDRLMLDEVESVPATTQRAIARWAAHRAYAVAGLAEIDWIKEALHALDHDRELPPPFDDLDRAWDAFFEDERVPHTVVSSLDGSVPYLLRQAMALPAVYAAACGDPLRAALDALYAAACTYGPDHPTLLGEVRLAFPTLGASSAYSLRPPPIPEQAPLTDPVEAATRSGATVADEVPGETPDDGAPGRVPGARKPGSTTDNTTPVD